MDDHSTGLCWLSVATEVHMEPTNYRGECLPLCQSANTMLALGA